MTVPFDACDSVSLVFKNNTSLVLQRCSCGAFKEDIIRENPTLALLIYSRTSGRDDCSRLSKSNVKGDAPCRRDRRRWRSRCECVRR